MVFNDEQQLFRETAKEFAETEALPHVLQIMEDNAFPEELMGKAVDLGFTGMTVSEEYGGSAQGQTEAAIVLEEIAKACPALAMALGQTIIGAAALAQNDAMAHKYLSRVVDGSLSVGVASDPVNDLQQATIAGSDDVWQLNGSQRFAANANANLLLVQAKDASGALHFAWVESAWSGVNQTAADASLGQAGAYAGVVSFKDVSIPVENVIDIDSDALSAMTNGLFIAQALGCAEALFALTIEFCENRTNANKPLVEFSAVRANLAEVQSMIDVCKAVVYSCVQYGDEYAATNKADVRDAWLRSSVSSIIRVSDMLLDAGYECIKLNGGMGYHDPHSWRYLADGLKYCIANGSDNAHLAALAHYMNL